MDAEIDKIQRQIEKLIDINEVVDTLEKKYADLLRKKRREREQLSGEDAAASLETIDRLLKRLGG